MPAPAARCWRQTCTGAAQKRFWVKTPATDEPAASSKVTKSLRLALRTPAMATPIRTPATGYNSAASGAVRLTVMRCDAVGQASLPWQCLYFLPLPQGQGSLRPTRGTAATSVVGSASCDTLPSSLGWV